MRTSLKVSMDVNAGNTAISDGSFPKVLKETMDRINPEATYFYAENGNRSCFMVFDLKDSSEIPGIAEPFFMVLKAKVEFAPVMNLEDMQKGLKAAVKSQHELVQ
jgi:hypothetical protein